jgi:hypothetical protein
MFSPIPRLLDGGGGSRGSGGPPPPEGDPDPGRGGGDDKDPTTCKAVPFKVTGIAPEQAPGKTAISQTPRAKIPNGGVAIKPQIFGVDGVNGSNRSVFLSIQLFANWSGTTVPAGIPTQGLFSPVDVIGPKSVRHSPGNMVDVYNYKSTKTQKNPPELSM